MAVVLAEFDAEVAFKRLSEKYNNLAQLVAKHFSQAGAPDRLLRAKSSKEIAEMLMRIVGGKKVRKGAILNAA